MAFSRRTYAVFALLIGFSIGMTNLLAPMHELYHSTVAAAYGVNSRITSWNTTDLASFNAPAVFAGWSSNLWFGVVAAGVFALIGRHTKATFLTGAGGLAYAGVSWARAFSSWDFNGAIKSYVSTLTDNPQIQYRAWMEIHHDIISRWTAIGLVLLICSLAFVLWNLKKKAA